jgi:hypothetical protein
MQKLRDRITYANVMATIALFVALGGVSYAAVNLPMNSVGSKQLKKNSVNSAKVRNGSLTLGDFKKSQRAKLRGPKGATGATGATGAIGLRGPAGISGRQIVSVTTVEDSETFKEDIAECPAGKVVFGGGATIETEELGEVINSIAIDGSSPLEGGTGWIAGAHEHDPTAEEWSLRIFAICGNAS